MLNNLVNHLNLEMTQPTARARARALSPSINIFNGKKSLIFPLGRNPQYVHWEEIFNVVNRTEFLEILNISNAKKSSIFSIASEAPPATATPATSALPLHDI